MSADMVPRTPGYVSVGSRRYNEWQTLAFEATTDREEVPPEEYTGPPTISYTNENFDQPKKGNRRENREYQEDRVAIRGRTIFEGQRSR